MTETTDYRFIIVDDHPLFRGALSQALGAAFTNAQVLEAGSLDELTDRLAEAGEVDLILLDLTMPVEEAPKKKSKKDEEAEEIASEPETKPEEPKVEVEDKPVEDKPEEKE